jgi:hypothetical protein
MSREKEDVVSGYGFRRRIIARELSSHIGRDKDVSHPGGLNMRDHPRHGRTMRRPVPALLIVAIAAACVGSELPPPEPASLASLLRAGTELVYESGDTQQHWVVEALEQPASIAGLTQCVRMDLRRAPTPARPESRAWCVQDLRLKSWNDSSLELTPLRPVGPDMTLELPLEKGTVRYETGGLERDTIGDMIIDVVPTTVTTLDSAGRTVRRLRERYALGLATATRGTFEEPDSVQPGSWRTTQQFRLVAVRRHDR